MPITSIRQYDYNLRAEDFVSHNLDLDERVKRFDREVKYILSLCRLT